MRRYNLAIACVHTSRGHPAHGLPASRDDIGERCRGAFSNALLDLPPSAFNEVIGTLALWAEQANAARADDEDDALFVGVDDLRRVAVRRPELLEFIEALERAEAQQAGAKATINLMLNRPEPPAAAPATPTVVSCNKHTDCDAADTAAKARGEERGAVHCHDDCCEDCFGS